MPVPCEQFRRGGRDSPKMTAQNERRGGGAAVEFSQANLAAVTAAARGASSLKRNSMPQMGTPTTRRMNSNGSGVLSNDSDAGGDTLKRRSSGVKISGRILSDNSLPDADDAKAGQELVVVESKTVLDSAETKKPRQRAVVSKKEGSRSQTTQDNKQSHWPLLDASVQEPWVTLWSRRKKVQYYFNKDTKKSRWTHPQSRKIAVGGKNILVPPSYKGLYYCRTCNVFCPSVEAYVAHILSEKYAQQVEYLRSTGQSHKWSNAIRWNANPSPESPYLGEIINAEVIAYKNRTTDVSNVKAKGK